MDRNTHLALVLSLLILMTWSTWQASRMPLPEAEEKGSVAAETGPPEQMCHQCGIVVYHHNPLFK